MSTKPTSQKTEEPPVRLKRKSLSNLMVRVVRATLIGLVAVGVLFYIKSREEIPQHLSGHTVLSIPNLISEEAGSELNELMRKLKYFDSNVNADLKSGFSGAREDIGEGRQLNVDGTCPHPFLIPNVNRTLCALPQRIDVGRHFLLTGGPDAVRESYEKLVDRLSSFGKYLVGDLSAYPVIEQLFNSEGFQSVAKQICPSDKQYLDPFQFNFIIQVPGQTVALHLDAPYFWGANRRDIPQWLLATMVFSNLFRDRFIDQVQVVGYLHRWSSKGKDVGGDFIYYPGGEAPSGLISPEPLSGNAVDGSKTVHAALVYRPDVSAPHIDKSSEATLTYVGDEMWHLVVDGQVTKVYSSDELRISIVYRARCFKDAEETVRYKNLKDDEKLTVEDVLKVLKDDLVARNVVSREKLNIMSTLKLALFLMDSYITYPLPSAKTALIPYNYCALPRLYPITKSFVSFFCP